MPYYLVDVDVDVDDVIDHNREYITEQLKDDILYDFLETLHRIQDIHGDEAVLEKLKDLYEENGLHVSYS